MKFNQWTLGLAAVGAISLASAARAEEGAVPLLTMLSPTTISGYVDTSAHWNLGTGNAFVPPYKFNNSSKADGFNLNVVQLSIAKPLDESEWAAGYKVDLWMGPDANALNTMSSGSWFGYYMDGPDGYGGFGDFAIRQAYVALRTPVGNGIDWKVGVFDSIIGYESVEAGNNPNYTRSYGHTLEPQTHTGLLATYRFNENISAAAGVANTVGPWINERAFYYDKAESYKTYMGSIALTAPESWGALAGSTLYAGVVNGFNSSSIAQDNTTSWYVGGTIATPVTGLKFGAALDYMDIHDTDGNEMSDGNVWSVGAYASYQVTEKLSLHLRGEYVDINDLYMYNMYYYGDYVDRASITAVTATVQYDLWQNVISRVEFRWDHSASADQIFGGEDYGYYSEPTRENAYLLAANIIYKF